MKKLGERRRLGEQRRRSRKRRVSLSSPIEPQPRMEPKLDTPGMQRARTKARSSPPKFLQPLSPERNVIEVESRSRPGRKHTLTRTRDGWLCSCEGYTFHGHCYHMAALAEMHAEQEQEFKMAPPQWAPDSQPREAPQPKMDSILGLEDFDQPLEDDEWQFPVWDAEPYDETE